MGIAENKALIRRFYEEIDKGNLEAMDELVAEGYISRSSGKRRLDGTRSRTRSPKATGW